jgi:site-specific DNA recombinase
VSDAFDRLLNRGQSLIEITAAMNESGLGNAARVRCEKPWTRRGVRWMLTSGRYAGFRQYHRGKDDEVTTGGNWPAIISVEDHERALQLLNDQGRWKSVSTGVRKHIGAGLFLCGCAHCLGKKTVISGVSSTGTKVYRCPDNHLSRPIAPVNELVVGVVEGYLAMPDGPAKLLATKDVPQIAELRAERSRLEAKIARAQRDYDDELLDGADLKAVKTRRQAEIKVIERKIAAAVKSSQLATIAASPDPVAAFRELGLNLRREILNALVTVTLLPAKRGRNAFDPDRVKVEWR